MKLEEYLKEIEQFLKDYLESSHSKCFVLGLSGGVDSSLVAAIAKHAVGKDKLFCYNIEIESHHSDKDDANDIAKELDVNLENIDLTDTYHSYLKVLKGEGFKTMTKANLKVRMRMVALYAYAQEKGGLVLGTDNMDEYYVGYFTKYGDGGVDLLPIVYLTKEEVRRAASHYGLSDKFVNRVPSAGLFQGQTDEKEMGIKYVTLDAFLLGKEIDIESKKRIEHLHNISEHKRNPIARPNVYRREE